MILAEDIKDVLFEKGEVILPGLGAFIGKYKSAAIDPVQGLITPPALDIHFDTNAVVNDGYLIDFIKRKHDVTAEDAQSAIRTFCETALAAFDRQELIVIPEVGRLYRDFNKKIQFLPDKTNFNPDSFGLPQTQFYPVSRNTRPESTATPQVTNTTVTMPDAQTTATPIIKPVFPEPSDTIQPPATTPSETPNWLPERWRPWLPTAVAALLVALSLIYYLISDSPKPLVTEGETKTPKRELPTTQPPTPNNVVPSPQQSPGSDQQPIASDKYFDKKATPSVGGSNISSGVADSKPTKKATILIGGFVQQNNIRRLERWIKQNGYEVYKRKSDDLTVVGAIVPYQTKTELRRIYRRFVNRYGDEVEIKYTR